MAIKEMPLFSIMIANFNNGRYLMDAIESVRCQTYENWEIILVDDGSTDNSQELYKQLETDTRIHIYYNEENKGCGYTKRRCVELANGELCGFLDPDDILIEPEAIRRVVIEHLENMMASLVYSNYVIIGLSREIKKHVNNCPIAKDSTLLNSTSWPVGHWCTFKKAMYEKTEGVDPFMRRAIDYDLWYKLEEVGSLHYFDECLYGYRIHDGSISMNDNIYKAHVWHSYACINAMKRRGLTSEHLMLFPIEYDLRNAQITGEEKIRKTHAYKLGKLLIKPFRLLKDLVSR